MSDIKKIAILTGGGDCPGLNPVIRAVVKTAIEKYGLEVVGIENGYHGLYRKRFVPLTLDRVQEIIGVGGTILHSSNKDNLFAYPVRDENGKIVKDENGKIVCEDVSDKAVENLKEAGIDALFILGGDGTLTSARDFARKGVKVMGIPKTIDNDLACTDFTFGFDTAISVACEGLDRIRTTGRSHHRIMVVEIMGRDAGWLTAASALSNHLCGTGPALIYLPEVAFDNDNFIKDVKAKLNESDYVVVAVSEGIRDKDGNYAAEAAMSGATDTFGHKYLAGTGKYLEELVRKEIGCKVRSVELNILQRCASHISSKTDIDESIRTGDAAVRFAVEGESGKMVVVRRIADSEEYAVETAVEDVKEIANKIKKMPKSFIDTKNNFVTDKCIEYMLPLIQGEYPSQFEDGLPVHFVF